MWNATQLYKAFWAPRVHLIWPWCRIISTMYFLGQLLPPPLVLPPMDKSRMSKRLLRHCPGGFGIFGKKRLNTRGFAREYLRSCTGYGRGRSVKRRGKSSSLHSKKFFAWGVRVFCEWRLKSRTFRPPWPTLPGPGCQPLGGSISLKFLLETWLQSESFDTLDDMLGFQVQKLWSKLLKIFD